LTVRLDPTYRAIATRYPTAGIYDRIATSAEYADVIAIEELTNPRIREERRLFEAKIRPKDRLFGPGTYPVVASFVYSQAGRFCDGSFGVYYAGLSEQTAIAESAYHTAVFLRATHQGSTDADKRIYTAIIDAELHDIRKPSMRAKVYDPSDYTASQTYGRRIYDADILDGILYNSVRDLGGHCVVAFRPRVITNCAVHKYVQLRWDGQQIIGTAELTNIRKYE
jgi:hypothetical protein